MGFVLERHQSRIRRRIICLENQLHTCREIGMLLSMCNEGWNACRTQILRARLNEEGTGFSIEAIPNFSWSAKGVVNVW